MKYISIREKLLRALKKAVWSDEKGIPPRILRTMNATNATIRFEHGPARDVQIMPFLGLRIALGFTGTGFAQPKPVSSRRTAPMGSTCAKGLRVSLPELSAV
jgi:hypothetical protein